MKVEQDIKIFTTGIAVEAIYYPQVVRPYRGHPFIEALPPPLSRAAAKEAMAIYPDHEECDRQASSIDREHMASLIEVLRYPVGIHAELYSRLSRLLRNGYLARNPLSKFFQSNIDAREDCLRVEGEKHDLVVRAAYPLDNNVMPSATGLTFLGISGIGKSAATEMCLRLFPQLIVHTDYGGTTFTRTQVAWLKFNAPPDGSIRTLIQYFFRNMDTLHAALGTPTGYEREYITNRTTIHKAVLDMARVAAQHGLGLLVLDEIQDMNPRGARAVLSFLVQLVNTVGVPVVLVGGLDALPTLSTQFRQARRGASEGDLILGRSEPGSAWRKLCEVVWQYQYTKTPTALDKPHVDALFEVCQGITQYLVSAYKLAQIRAIVSGEETGSEEITPSIIRSVRRDSLMQAAPVLNALRRNQVRELRRFGDVVPPEGYESVPFVRRDPPPPVELVDTVATTSPTTRAASTRASKRQVSVEGTSHDTPIDLGPPLPTTVQDGRNKGLTAHQVLVDSKVIGNAVWNRICDAERSPKSSNNTVANGQSCPDLFDWLAQEKRRNAKVI